MSPGRTPTAECSPNVALPVLAAPRPPHGATFGSRRGRRRAWVLAGVWLLMLAHVVQWAAVGTTLAPIEPSESMQTAKDGIVTVGTVLFALALASTALLGRWFCGWGCHWVAIQDAVAWFLARRGIRPRPFRSRLLAWLPLALGLYMFAWPIAYRLAVAPWVQPDLRWPGFTARFATQDFWATFPGLAMGLPFVLVSGVLVVWLLGAKGYCTYGCPYGGLFAPADELAPMRIVVDHDRCHSCGRCTAACTSNVRVHEEVRDHGMVVDPGCMKCMDCVASCPNEALRFGLGRPAVAVPRPAPPAGRVDLTWPEEIAFGCLGVGTLLAVRGGVGSVPLLFASGIAACTVFVSWKAWRTVRDPSTSFRGRRLRLRGRIGAAGVTWLAATGMLLCGVAYVGALNASAWIADRAEARVGMPAEIAFSEAAADLPPTEATILDARAALAWRTAVAAPPAGWSLLPSAWRVTDVRRAYLLAVARDYAAAEAIMRSSWERDGPDEACAAIVGRLVRMQPGRRDDALRWYAEALDAHPAWDGLRRDRDAWLSAIP